MHPVFTLLCSLCIATVLSISPWTDLPNPAMTGPMCCLENGAPHTLFEGPARAGVSREQWREALDTWRKDTLASIQYRNDAYDDPRTNWTRTSYVQPQVHLFDRLLYSRDQHAFTVSRYLKDVETRYGGIDSVLLWPTYPNIGLDDRNQWDMWRATPGGMDALAKLSEEFHQAGVRVLWGKPSTPICCVRCGLVRAVLTGS